MGLKFRDDFRKPEKILTESEYITCICGEDLFIEDTDNVVTCLDCCRVWHKVEGGWAWNGKFRCENCEELVDRVYNVGEKFDEFFCKKCTEMLIENLESRRENLNNKIERIRCEL